MVENLVANNHKSSSILEGPDASIDFEFAGVDMTGLYLDSSDLGETTLTRARESLAFRVARTPSDLANHLRRIRLNFDVGNFEDLYASLLDLFLVLKDNGHSLRLRLVKAAKPNLRDEHYGALMEILNAGYGDRESFPATRFSMLRKGLQGTSTLVSVKSNTPKTVRDPLDEARECIEYSQIEEARLILESALLTNPDRREIHVDLLEIYRVSRDQSNFKKMKEKLESLVNPYLEIWQETVEYFAGVD